MKLSVKLSKTAADIKVLINKAKVLPVCCRCARVPRNGLYDGFRVAGMFFCSDCQQELFAAEQGSPEYQEFLCLVQEILF